MGHLQYLNTIQQMRNSWKNLSPENKIIYCKPIDLRQKHAVIQIIIFFEAFQSTHIDFTYNQLTCTVLTMHSLHHSCLSIDSLLPFSRCRCQGSHILLPRNIHPSFCKKSHFNNLNADAYDTAILKLFYFLYQFTQFAFLQIKQCTWPVCKLLSN